MDHPPVGDDRKVRTLPADPGLAQGSGVVLRRQLFLDRAVEVLVLQEDHRIVVADRRLDQALGVVGRGRLDDLEARRMHVRHLDILGMERASVDVAARRSPDHHGDRLAPAIAALGGEVGDLVEAAGHEVRELHLEHGAQAVDGGAGARPDDGGLGQRRVDDALLAETLQHALGDLERAAVDGDVLAHDEDIGIPLHLFPDALADRFDVGGFGHGVMRSRGGI